MAVPPRRSRVRAGLAAAAPILAAALAAGCGGVPEGEVSNQPDVPSYEEQMEASGYDANNRPRQ